VPPQSFVAYFLKDAEAPVQENAGDAVIAFVFIQVTSHQKDPAQFVARIPEVEEVHRVAGKDCYIVRVRVANTEELGCLVREKIETIKSVSLARTTIVLKTLKDKGRLRRSGNQ
jgi:Lrp/AsnC family transcriptional regulator, leucine-responsive regulatory protein